MPISIRPLDLKNDPTDFVEKHLSKHFDWSELREELRQDSIIPAVFIALSREEIIGVILLHPCIDEAEHNHQYPADSVWIYRLDVEESHRNQGIGQALMKEAENYARTHNIPELWLDTIQAGDYYEQKLGYTCLFSQPYKDQMTRVYKKKLT